MARYCPDFSSSEDEFDDPDFKESMRQKRIERIQKFNGNLNPKLEKEQKQKKILNDILQRNNEEVLRAVYEVVGLNETFDDDWTLINYAASVGNYELVVKLFELGADISAKRGGDTILMLACDCPLNKASSDEILKIIKFLVEVHVDLSARNRKRMNALMFAARNGNESAVSLLNYFIDLYEEDNQCWNVLFWAVYSGNISLVSFLMDLGMSPHQVDIRGNTPLDIAIDHNFKDIVDLFMKQCEEKEVQLPSINPNFIDTFQDLQEKEKPIFFENIFTLLHSVQCENLVELFVDNKISLLELLSYSEAELERKGVSMPFQRRSLTHGIYRFHKTPFEPNSIPFVKKDDLYSNIDVAEAILCSVKQLICMEAALKFIMKHVESSEICGNEEIVKTLNTVRSRLVRLMRTIKKLQKKAVEWDKEIEPANVITSYSGKRWFPWRKTIGFFSIAALVSLKLWNYA